MTLVILAAGMGRRFGGVKQIEPVGADGELIIDYSVFDAAKAGFDKFVFVIRRDIESDFKAKFFDRISARFRATCVFQDTPAWREKPLGTLAAVLAAKDAVDEPFCLINADDFYGAHAFRTAAEFLRNGGRHGMVAYRLAQTLSEFGAVSRGVISVDAAGMVSDIRERLVEPDAASSGELCSVNFFAFHPEIFRHFQRIFDSFMVHLGGDQNAECYLSENVGRLAKDGTIALRALSIDARWLGFTYRADQSTVATAIAGMDYPRPLWSN